MEIQGLIYEVALAQVGGDTNAIFNYSLKQVFSPTYVNKIEKEIQGEIKIKEIVSNKNFVSYQQGDTIFINKPIFYSKSKEEQIRNLLHEFMHILQASKKMLFFSKFKEINAITTELYEIVKQNLVGSLAQFFVGEDVKMLSSSKEEVLGYLMTGKIGWEAISPQGKKEFIKAMDSSGIFNLNTSFWKKRLFS